MADVRKTVQSALRTGVSPAYTAAPATGSDVGLVRNDGRVILYFKNGATNRTVTIQTPAKVAGLDVAELSVAVAANTERVVGPFPPSVFNDSSQDLRFSADAAGNLT